MRQSAVGKSPPAPSTAPLSKHLSLLEACRSAKCSAASLPAHASPALARPRAQSSSAPVQYSPSIHPILSHPPSPIPIIPQRLVSARPALPNMQPAQPVAVQCIAAGSRARPLSLCVCVCVRQSRLRKLGCRTGSVLKRFPRLVHRPWASYPPSTMRHTVLCIHLPTPAALYLLRLLPAASACHLAPPR